MRIVIATDSFKECMSANQACSLIKAAIAEGCPQAEISCFPLADGGEGTGAALMAKRPSEWVEHRVTGPLPDTQVDAGFVWFADTRTALVEMARASGLELLTPEQRNPLKTTTLGTGELIKAARGYGAQKILLAVGGSATVDLGIGCAAALGWRFLDAREQAVTPVGENLLKIQKLQRPAEPLDIPVEVLCDVTNPLLGVNGAAKVFGPQKGAGRADVVLLEVGLTNVSHRIAEELQVDIRQGSGGGAAGGLAAGAAAFLDASLVSGVDYVLEQTGALQAMAQADWVLTGEGSFDEQSLDGKVVSGVVSACREHQIPVTVFAGRITLSEGKMHEAGVHEAFAITPPDIEHRQALIEGPKWLTAAALEWVTAHGQPS